MASDIFLRVGDLKGESADQQHPEEITVVSWKWGIERQSLSAESSGHGHGVARVRDLWITKFVDTATPWLLKRCITGTAFSQVTLVLRRSGLRPHEYLQIKLTNAVVVEVQEGSNVREDFPQEAVRLAFSQVQVEYAPQKRDGTAGPALGFKWDIPANAEV